MFEAERLSEVCCLDAQFVRKFEGKPYKVPRAPPLPNYRVKEAPAFLYIELDYIGPLFVTSTSEEER